MGAELGQVPFQAQVELLRLLLVHRERIVDSIEGVLNAQRHLHDPSLSSQHFENCFFISSHAHLRGQLEAAHWAGGFKPRPVHHLHNDLIHPAEMMLRAVHCWQQTRWPGRNGRLHYAHTLFNLYVLRCLQFLSMRVFENHLRLADVQDVLDALWRSSPANQPALVRDARWLIPLAQSLITDELYPYFEVAQQVADTLPEADSLEIQKAHVRMLGGHLASQVRYYSTKSSVPINDPSVVLRTRTSNALDFALLVQGLVELLKSYDRSGDERMRLDMAGAIFQGISADPELFLNRIDLLSAYSMIEHLFIDTVGYSPLGQRHVQLLAEYRALMDRSIQSLREDLPRFRPVDAGFSTYGVIFGLPSSLIEHMALKAIEHDAETRFSLEDLFNDESSAAKLAWVNGWRDLPHVAPAVQRLYDYPQQFAEEIYDRLAHELGRHERSTTGRLCIVGGGDTELPTGYFVSSDRQLATVPYDQAQLLRERQEGLFLVSYETPGGWIAIQKELLTEVLGAGRDATVAGLPSEAAHVLRLMCTGLATQ
jgi:hypothetical protein